MVLYHHNNKKKQHVNDVVVDDDEDYDSEESSDEEGSIDLLQDGDDAVLSVVPGTFQKGNSSRRISPSGYFDGNGSNTNTNSTSSLSSFGGSMSSLQGGGQLRGGSGIDGRPGFNPWTEKSFTKRNANSQRRRSSTRTLEATDHYADDDSDDDEDDCHQQVQTPAVTGNSSSMTRSEMMTRPPSDGRVVAGGARSGVRGLFRNVKLNLQARKLRSARAT